MFIVNVDQKDRQTGTDDDIQHNYIIVNGMKLTYNQHQTEHLE